MSETNWAGNYQYQARAIHAPTSVQQVQAIVARARRVRVLGSRHSFNAIADSDELISLARLPPAVVVDRAAGTVSCSPGISYGALARELDAHGLALHNLASLPHLSLGGAVATGSHGSGDRNGSLATQVAGMHLVTAGGDLLRVSRGDPDFDGLVVGLGAVGAVVRLTLDVEPAYRVRQRVYEGLAWPALFDHFDAIAASGYSVSLFTTWGASVEQVWVKTRVDDAPEPTPDDLFGAVPATADRHPLADMDPLHCTPQLGRPGAWWERLPHFRLGFTPSRGDELQSEYLLPRTYALPAIEAVRGLAERIRPVLLVGEIRTVAADSLWMSPQYGRPTVAIHFTWRPRPGAVRPVLKEVEHALARFEARPHWGKLFGVGAEGIAAVYERQPHFARLVERLDPRGVFRNAWLDAHVVPRRGAG